MIGHIIRAATLLAGIGLGGMAAAQTTCATAGIATGGTISQITLGDQIFCVHSFSTAGTSTFILNQNRDVEYLIIGGGGGAGTGGGGAGGMLEGTIARTAASYTVTVGAGGAATQAVNNSGATGGNSSVFGIVANGGGGGGRAGAGGNGLAGGSGGGAARDSNSANSRVGGTGISGQGFAGADNVAGATNAGGGGGGAGGPGNGINGGPGRASSITGTAVTYAGGGATAAGTAAPFTNGTNGIGQDQPGGGGDHGEAMESFFNPGRAGVVILRYVANAPPAANAGPDVTVTQGATVTLNGLGSTDPENNIQSYAWTRVTGTSGTLSNENTAQASFVAAAPANGSSETLTFRLTVTDAFGLSTTDDISVTVLAASNPPPPAAGGGNSVFDYLDPATQRTFRVHVFEQNGTFTLDRTRDIDYLIVGGGGGGGAIAGGGGGAGGLRQGTVMQAAGNYSVVVGAGGAGDNRTNWPSSFSSGQSGGPSSVFGVEAAGGGGGGTFNTSGSNVGDALNGGSGGGASHAGTVGQPSPAGQGFAGGTGTGGEGNSSGGGGGGAGQAGTNGSGTLAGRGGDGVQSSITGTPVFYAGGGAGGGDIRGDRVEPNVGGAGGGGDSTDGPVAGSGTPGTGGGGAGGRAANNGIQSTGGNGGSGVVILRYVVNTPPVANAGPDADAFAGLEFTLNGTGSTDAENNITAYLWEQTGGTTQSLTGADTAQARFTPGQPASGTSETLTFRLTVTDAFGAQSTDEVVITLQGLADLTATKTARVFSEDGTGCANLSATPPTSPANPAAIPGACIEYTITVQNTGPVAATAITLTDILPGELTYVAEGRSNWAASTLAVSGNTVTISDGTIDAGQTATLILRATLQ